MINSKSAFQSVGLAGAVATVFVGAGQLLGYAIDPADAQQLSQLIFGGVTIVTGIVAAVGRIRAKAQLRFKR